MALGRGARGAAGLIRFLAVVIVVSAACGPNVAPPTSSAVAAASPTPTQPPTPTPSPAPTTAAPSPTATRYLDAVLGFSVAVPQPWRVSECLSRSTTEGSYLGQAVLTTRTIAEERDLGAGGDTGPTGAATWVITIAAETSSLSPAEYATTRGGSLGDTLQATTIDGRPAVRVTAPLGRGGTYYVANTGRMYAIGLAPGLSPYDPQPPAVTEAVVDSIARSITFTTPIARPTPTPTPQLTPAVEAVVDAVAAAFAASDADRLRELMPPTCWFQSAGYQSSGVLVSREKMGDLLRSSFAQGRRVTVDARPIKRDAPFLRGPFWVWSTWSAYNAPSFMPESVTQLVFDQIDGRWYWTGALFNAGQLKQP